MLSRYLFGEPTPPGDIRPGEPIGMSVLGSTTIAGHEGLPELLSGELVPGSNALAV
jgi:hypothetical protein